MRFKVEVLLALVFGGLSLTGLILPILGYVFLGLASVVLVDIVIGKMGYVIRLTLPIRLAKRTSEFNPKNQPDWMTAALNRDTKNFPRCMFIHNLRIDWAHLHDTDSYFLIHCDIYSSSVFRIGIGKMVDGHLRYKSQRENAELERTPEVLNPIEQLERSITNHLTVRQWVSQSMMNTIALDGGNLITLDFSGVNIWVKGVKPDGSDGPKSRLPLPHEYQVSLATQPEIENQLRRDKEGSQP